MHFNWVHQPMMGHNHTLQENNQSPVSGKKANAVLWRLRKVRLYVKAAAVTRCLLQNANMAGDGESLESCLSKFLLKLLFSRGSTGREVFCRVLYIYRCPKFRVHLHDIVESETGVELIRLVLSESVLRQLLATEGLLFTKISKGVWLSIYLLDPSWPEHKRLRAEMLAEHIFSRDRELWSRGVSRGTAPSFYHYSHIQEVPARAKNKRD